MTAREYDLIAVGGGTAGLVSAAGAAYLGLRAAVVERDRLGGDCLWRGCVPSKALIASARLVHAAARAERLGLRSSPPAILFREVMDRMRRARETVGAHDDPERFRAMGVDVLFGTARFTGPDTVAVEGAGTVRSKRIVIATGSHPAVPPIPGLTEAGFLTNESAFDQDTLPSSITILGGGPIGLEFAQIYARLGSRVTLLEQGEQVLPREDPDVARLLAGLLAEEGIGVETSTRAGHVERTDGKKVVVTADGRRFEAEEVFVATGRAPSTASLALDRAGIETERDAVKVDDTLATSARGIWAAGDVVGRLQFTHLADHMAKVVLRNSIFPFRTRVDYGSVPWVTYTDPEIAHIGMGQEEAEAEGGRTFTYPFERLDRAIVAAETHGMVKVSVDRRGKILGATIVGSHAGELLQPLVLAKSQGIPLSKLSDTIYPYPTLVEGVKRTADEFQKSRLEGRGGRILRKVVSWLT